MLSSLLKTGRLAREARTIEAMVRMYCRAKHSSEKVPCRECGELLEYALGRVAACRFGAEKPVCSKCPVHCYRKDMRERVIAVMRFAGPRLIYSRPFLALAHIAERFAFGAGPPKVPRKSSGDRSPTKPQACPPEADEIVAGDAGGGAGPVERLEAERDGAAYGGEGPPEKPDAGSAGATRKNDMETSMQEKLKAFIREYKAHLILFAILAAIFAASAVYALFGPPHMIMLTETPEFCAKCHLHDTHYKSWAHTGAHRSNKCVDCHLPNDNFANHFVWKSIDGVKDMALFFSGNVSDNPKLTAHAKAVTQANCIRCHSEVVFRIDKTSRNCWDCHRTMTHKYSGAH